MKALPLVWRIGPGILALGLGLLTPVLRADDAAGKLSKAKEKYDTDKDGKLSAEEKARARDGAAGKAKAREEEQRKAALDKYDANGNGQLEANEQARMKSDATAQAEKYKRALARYDANANGALDRDELAKMKKDEMLAARTDRQAAEGEAKFQRKLQKARQNDPTPKARKP